MPQPGFSQAQVSSIRADFPLLSKPGRNGQPIAYFDFGATSQKPFAVLSAIEDFYRAHNGAVARGTHILADEATQLFEDARETVAAFIGAHSVEELCWTKNATEAINLVAAAFDFHSTGLGASKNHAFHIGTGDEILVTRAEHHSNLVPWQRLCARTGAKLKWIELDAGGRLLGNGVELINQRTRIVAVTHMSNVTGAITDIAPIVAAARANGAYILADTCQSSAHMPVNVSELGVDFAVFSSHKMLGPTGIGALWSRKELADQLPPFLLGGSMVAQVTMEETTFLNPPARFEAGSQAVAQAVGWARACQYLQDLGMCNIAAHEHALGEQLLHMVSDVPGVRLLGDTDMYARGAVFCFDIPGVHPHDVGQFLDSKSVAVRVGHHCAQPIHAHFGVKSSTRASLGLTNTSAEVERFVAALTEVPQFFAVSK